MSFQKGHSILKGRKLPKQWCENISKGKKGWNGRIGSHHSEETKRKIGLSRMIENPGYVALHAWVRRHKGTPKKCEHCGTKKARKYEWANIDHSYRRDVNDYIRLCTSCHRIYDKNNLGV